VGAPGLEVGTDGAGGGVVVLHATSAGLSSDAQVITADSPGVAGDVESNEHFGQTFASGDFDDDGYADLAVGRPVARFGTGGVTVLYGSHAGLSGTRSTQLADPGGHGSDLFGLALVAGTSTGTGAAISRSAPRSLTRPTC
jgi:FG-GAP repeat